MESISQQEQSLATSLGATISENATDTLSNIIEIGLDSIMDEGVLKDIPFISTAISIYKIGRSIHERHNIKKLAIFLDELNRGAGDQQARETYVRQFSENQKKRNQELEYLIVLLDRYIEFDRPQMLAKLYMDYLKDKITWLELSQYSVIIERLLPGDYLVLKENEYVAKNFHYIKAAHLRLVSLGLMAQYDDTSKIEDGLLLLPTEELHFVLTPFGKKLCDIIG